MTPLEQAEFLERELVLADIAFTLHASAGQRPQASFRYCENNGPELAFTAIIRSGALQLSVPDLLTRCSPAQTELPALNDSWGIGHARYDGKRGSCKLSAGYPVFARRLEKRLLKYLVPSLYWAGAAFSSGSSTPWRDAREAAKVFRAAFPESDITGAMSALAAVLHEIGHPFDVVGHGRLRQTFYEADGNRFTVMIESRDDRFIRVETIAQTPASLSPEDLKRLNEIAPIGCFIPGDLDASFTHLWEFPPEFMTTNERLAAWLIEVGAQMSAAARCI